MNFVEELQWRGMLHDMTPGTDEQLSKEMTTAYIGFDPTADSLHVGSFAQIMLLKLFQLSGHKPIALLGGATGMIGDPSGRSQERNLLDEELLNINLQGIRKQLSKFLDFDSGSPNVAEMVNNYNWMKDYTFLNFIRDIGKHITVNYMMSKDSVKKRISSESREGMSFTEFTYQLVQGYDFLWLYQNMNCKIQMGGSDQWGNITTGTELIRRKEGGEAFALTIPLITKADGTKFGKTEAGNVWLDPERTSPYEFYQYWLNTSDEDAEKYIKIFTLLDCNTIESLISLHREKPHERLLQQRLAEEVTVMVHSSEDYQNAVEASQILFTTTSTEEETTTTTTEEPIRITSNKTAVNFAEQMKKLDNKTFLSIFEGVPKFNIAKNEIEKGVSITDLLTSVSHVFPSKSELRRTIQGNGLSINKEKISDPNLVIDASFLINEKYILIQKGKKSYYLLFAE